MIKRILTQVSRFVPFKNLKMSEMLSEAFNKQDDETSQKRELENKEENAKQKKQKTENDQLMQGRADRKRKVALLLVYSGKGYYGLQRNPGFPTIESELLEALVAAEAIPQDHADYLYKMSFQRASRTDKGVSAAGQVISLKMLLNIDNLVEKINENLPPQIRVLGFKRATNGFDSQKFCNARTYVYILPTYALAPLETFVTDEYRVTDEILKKTKEILSMFLGTHNFHNFTSGIKPTDPSARRYISFFQTDKHAFVRNGIEYVKVTVKGQSFMMHHIRKMIGLTIAIVRGFCGVDVLHKAWTHDKLDVPKAPGLGLLLDKLHYDAYNNKFGKDGIHEPIDWTEYQDQIEKFKEDCILSEMMKTEKEEKVMFKWLSTLHFHKFDVINLIEDQKMYAERRRLNKLLEETKSKKELSSTNSDVTEDKPSTPDEGQASSMVTEATNQKQETVLITTTESSSSNQKQASSIPVVTEDSSLAEQKQAHPILAEEADSSLAEHRRTLTNQETELDTAGLVTSSTDVDVSVTATDIADSKNKNEKSCDQNILIETEEYEVRDDKLKEKL